MGKRELVALLNLSSWRLVMVEWLFLAMPWGCLRFVIVVFPDHTHFICVVTRPNYFVDQPSLNIFVSSWSSAFKCSLSLCLQHIFFKNLGTKAESGRTYLCLSSMDACGFDRRLTRLPINKTIDTPIKSKYIYEME